VIHFDETRAVEPVERTAEWEEDKFPETDPSGLQGTNLRVALFIGLLALGFGDYLGFGVWFLVF